MKKFALPFFCFALLLGAGCNKEYRNLATVKKARNIILLIGDGMGLTQVSAAFHYQEEPASFARFQYIGLFENEATDAKITDSAAGATAFASGVQTYNAAIGVGPDTVALPTILELAAERGLSTGLVATSSIQHATPASFYAHVAHRNMYEEIARQLVTAPVDFFAGGGLQFFNRRADSLDYLDSLRQKGFTIDTTALPANGKLNREGKYGYLLAPDGLPKMTEGRGDFLPRATQLALDYLSQNSDGFFLMVEGSQIDWGGHSNEGEYLIEEVKDFDKAIHAALNFAERDGNTLVIVTADHETGGLALSAAQSEDGADYNRLQPTFSTGGHTAALIPVFAFGPGAENFAGVYHNYDLFEKMVRSTGW